MAPNAFCRANGVLANRSRNNEGLGIVHCEGLKRLTRAFDNRFPALHEVQNVHPARSIVRDRRFEPVPSRFDKLPLMQPGTLLFPARTLADGFRTIHQVLPHPLGVAIPLDVRCTVFQVDGTGPAEHAELADSLSMAFLVMLEELSPVERAVFMLREVFGYRYPAVARITGKTEVNCRQIFARARQRISAGAQTHTEPPVGRGERRAEGEELARRFFEAAGGGDMEALLDMLAPDVVFHGDGGGKAQAIARPLAGRERVVRLIAGIFRRGRFEGTSLRLAWVNGQPGAVLYDAGGRVVTVVELEIADGVVQALHAVVNPDKLGHLGPVSDLARRPRKE